jgi:hypothetical protein
MSSLKIKIFISQIAIHGSEPSFYASFEISYVHTESNKTMDLNEFHEKY